MMSLLRSTFVLFSLIYGLGISAQIVTNVTVQQAGQELEISYSLETTKPVDVGLYISTDHGNNWQGPLTNCSGDVGKNVLAGTNKRIRWVLLEERELVGEGIRFKVVANAEVMKPWLNPSLNYGSVTDIDGNTYATIQIGTQVWMAENLRTTRYKDGTLIPNVKDDGEWRYLSTGAWSNYENDPRHDAIYGKLYNGFAVADKRGLCSKGWHLPTDEEWMALEQHLGMEPVDLNGDHIWRGLAGNVGGKMKADQLWGLPNSGANNESGFSGLPGGYRLHALGFHNLGRSGSWWSVLESLTDRFGQTTWKRSLGGSSTGTERSAYGWSAGFCVRCVRD